VTTEQLEQLSVEQRDAVLQSPDVLVRDFPAVTLDQDSAYYLGRGQAVWKSGLIPQGWLRLYEESGRFLGLGELDADGKVAPRRLVVSEKIS